jgi:hypothetical protein
VELDAVLLDRERQISLRLGPVHERGIVDAIALEDPIVAGLIDKARAILRITPAVTFM